MLFRSTAVAEPEPPTEVLSAVEKRRPRHSRPEASQGGVREACAEQRVVQEGSSPSGAQMRGAISKSGGNASLAEESRRYADV